VILVLPVKSTPHTLASLPLFNVISSFGQNIMFSSTRQNIRSSRFANSADDYFKLRQLIGSKQQNNFKNINHDNLIQDLLHDLFSNSPNNKSTYSNDK